jgi:hypothetical protein
VNKDIRLSNLVKDKDVLLVGNSSSLLKKDNSDLIDSFEFVVRFNLSISHLHSYSIGRKCDAWIFAMCRDNVIRRTYEGAKIKPKICVRYGAPFCIGDVNINLDVNKGDVRKELNIEEDTHPSTGIATTWYMVNKTKAKSVSLIGFDSFMNHNFYTKTNRAHLCHSLEAEKKYLSELAENKRINLIDV